MGNRIIFFSLAGCSMCEQFKPVFEKVAKEHNLTYEFYQLPDAPREIKLLVYKYSIEKFPTVLIMEGEKTEKIEGSVTESKLIEKLRIN